MKYDRPAKEDHPCLFCGKPGQAQRTVNLVTVDLCNDDYYNHTLGAIAAQLRERDKQAEIDRINAKIVKTRKTNLRKKRARRRKEKHGSHTNS